MTVVSSGVPRIITPGLTDEEDRAKSLAVRFIEEAGSYTNRELLAALAIAAASTLRVRYKPFERDQAYGAFVGMVRHVKDQV